MIGLPLLVQAHSETGIQKLAGRQNLMLRNEES